MRITQESDYALRILTVLASHTEVVDAHKIATETSVSLRFTVKILHKLTADKLVKSFKGASGGYRLCVPPDEITLKSVIELIDGQIAISRCLDKSETCSMTADKTSCLYHHIFDSISMDVARKLQAITIADVIEKKYRV